MVSKLAFYSVDPSSNPADVYSFNSVNYLKRTKINKKRPGLAHLKKDLSSWTVQLAEWAEKVPCILLLAYPAQMYDQLVK